MKNKVQEHFGNRIFISTIPIRSMLLLFQQMLPEFLASTFLDQVQVTQRLKRLGWLVVAAATKLIKSDIRPLSASKETFPGFKDVVC